MSNEREINLNEPIEARIIGAIRRLLQGRVNELLGEMEFPIPLIEFSDYKGKSAVVPVISLASCERTEKERIIRSDAYTFTIAFSLIDTVESEFFCYAYSGAIGKAIFDNPTLSGVVDRAVITGKKYIQPKAPKCGEGWGVTITLHVTVERIDK